MVVLTANLPPMHLPFCNILLPHVIEGHLGHLYVHLHRPLDVVVSPVCDSLLIHCWSVGAVLLDKNNSLLSSRCFVVQREA